MSENLRLALLATQSLIVAEGARRNYCASTMVSLKIMAEQLTCALIESETKDNNKE